MHVPQAFRHLRHRRPEPIAENGWKASAVVKLNESDEMKQCSIMVLAKIRAKYKNKVRLARSS